MAQRERKRAETVPERVLKELKKLRAAVSSPSSVTSASQLSFDVPPFEVERTLILDKMIELGISPVPAAEYLRLRSWLQAADEENLPNAFAAILQVWLHAHGIDWPKGVFDHDLARAGTGMHKESAGEMVIRLRGKGWSDEDIAKRKFSNLYADNRAKATRKVRDAARNFRPREDPLDSQIGDLAGSMLGHPQDPVEDVEFEIYREIDREHSGVEEPES